MRLRYLLRRLAGGLLVVLLVIVFCFVILRLAPGDPAMIMAGESGASDEQFIADIRRSYGLDQPLPVQLAKYLGNVLQFDLGFSYRQKRPNAELIAERLPATLLLAASAFVLSLALGIVLGYLAARFRGLADAAVSIFSLAFYATPIFWIGLMGILVFSVQLEWLPAFGMRSILPVTGGWAKAADVARHLILPTLTLGLFYTAIYARLMRASLLEVRPLDFVATARAKGASIGRVWRRHMFRNAVLPVLTMAGVQAGQIVGGSILVETVFAWPGIGRLAFEAVFQRDYNLLLGIFLVTSTAVVAINIATDFIYTLVDPRTGPAR
ncbi:peptide/nickel transport system permease protein [Stella humosa]|uniref:Peptide/nickel transport system permease protein n=1 Tax=Stella humosa TaxID=94 RepID=A0A3N1LWS5_9PROT|nr:ABC transporter permease [Stella humosa]ROP99633.1 peptide/nickel transport system permease protein [Stella humosa]BBK31142.1 ABC transporter permease [Stella humosa]